MNESEQVQPQSLARWREEVETWAYVCESEERSFRSRCMFLERLPENWYAITEAMIAMESNLRVIRTLLNR
jgi:hypothetical protein